MKARPRRDVPHAPVAQPDRETHISCAVGLGDVYIQHFKDEPEFVFAKLVLPGNPNDCESRAKTWMLMLPLDEVRAALARDMLPGPIEGPHR